MQPRSLLLVSFLLSTLILRAEHLPGGSITYQCLGNNTYTVTLTLFRECSGEAMIPQDLRFTNDCGVVFTLSALQPQEVADISPLCASEQVNSSCNGGQLIGYQAYTYRQTLFLSPCNAWTISWSICCRQNSINVQGAPGLYLEARLNNQGGLCNNSPTITVPGLPVVCVGQSVVYDPGVVETDGNTLAFRFIEARYGTPAPFPVSYNFPYYGLEPFTDMSIDPLTGRISFLPTIQGYIVTVFQVDEYNASGAWIGSVMRDFPFLVSACSNTVPLPGTGLISNVTGTGSADGDQSVRVCSNGEVCMDLVFTDPDAGQTLSINTNVGLVLPGATVSSTGTNPLNVQICWNATGVAPMTRYFTIGASDNACPVPGTQSYTYRVTVQAPPAPIASGSASVCAQTAAFALADSLGSTAPVGGSWSGPSGNAHSGSFDPSIDPPGNYIYSYSSFPGCSTSATVSVSFLPAQDPACISLYAPELVRKGPLLFPNPGTGKFILRGGEALGSGPFTARVMDLQGRMVHQFRMPGILGDTPVIMPEGIAPGSYLLLLEGTATSLLPIRFTLER